jgi:ligand-binding sensor domain-containing protein
MKLVSISVVSALAGLAQAPQAQGTPWEVHKVSNTGIPGGEVTFAKIDPEGDVWVSATDPWNPSGVEGGVAEFDGVVWTNHSNINSPLPTPHVASVVFDTDGSEWIATNGGLIHRQDGTWTNYTSSNSPLPNNSMGELTFDSTGGLWMLHWDGQVSRFDGSNWNSWTKEQLGWVPTIVPSTLVVDANDDVWVGTAYAGGLSKLEWGSVGPSATWQTYGNGAPSLFFGDDGNVWAIDLDINLRSAIYRYDGMNRTQMPDLGPGNIPYSTLRILADGTYWVGTYTGLVGYYDGSGFTTYLFGNSFVFTIDVDAEGHAWVSGKGGVKELDPATGQWTYFHEKALLSQG